MTSSSAPPQPAQIDPQPQTKAPPKSTVEADHIFVYKYDGSLQCGMGKPVSVAHMKRQLKGIKVFSASKRSDGLMHIQVCGSTTGKANVYEIRARDLKKAEECGFKKWSFE